MGLNCRDLAPEGAAGGREACAAGAGGVGASSAVAGTALEEKAPEKSKALSRPNPPIDEPIGGAAGAWAEGVGCLGDGVWFATKPSRRDSSTSFCEAAGGGFVAWAGAPKGSNAFESNPDPPPPPSWGLSPNISH